MDTFKPKLAYVKKVISSSKTLEQVEIAGHWGLNILKKHSFKNGQDGYTKAIIQIHKSIKITEHNLENIWMKNNQ
jgi:hypothetical protein